MTMSKYVIFLVNFKEKEEKKKWLVFLHSEETWMAKQLREFDWLLVS